MAQTPTDPTKAQVWITKGIDDLDFEFYFPQGPKGDPGGFTLGTPLDNTVNTGTGKYDLNDVLTNGIYRLTATVDNLLARNYPRNYDTGILEVFERVPGQTVIQVWHTLNQTARMRFERTYVTGTWSPWRLYTSTRVDQTAGRSMYVFDDINNREQLIWGDTGWRNISQSPETNTTFMRRIGSMVQLQFTNHACPGGNYVFPLQIPAGFRPSITLEAPYRQGAMAYGNTKMVGLSSSGNITFWGSLLDTVSTSAVFMTSDPWPTTLPGTNYISPPNI
ncbi:hypothetical protein SEA_SCIENCEWIZSAM_25 [Arthrobacter phage ScienceWizSam]|uniref:Minor tail protein n=1 Tax=Arthrobacter phage ScienceWizSam TaxID=2927283 RepID=A0A9E7P5Z3_9CAUD|nr:hypothetical protein QCN41_gp25 [Arthrobacter phage ScienceWizSam]UUG69269.1 hypothetical protein SEA_SCIENCEWIZSAM_25 [Arthrobacter phage ScienceWizSam]